MYRGFETVKTLGIFDVETIFVIESGHFERQISYCWPSNKLQIDKAGSNTLLSNNYQVNLTI